MAEMTMMINDMRIERPAGWLIATTASEHATQVQSGRLAVVTESEAN